MFRTVPGFVLHVGTGVNVFVTQLIGKIEEVTEGYGINSVIHGPGGFLPNVACRTEVCTPALARIVGASDQFVTAFQ